ncbi:MAG: hypothetical protein IJC16_09075 [Rikenellaceae bacterium]|nr:hypothetical protein [Rikenellaceae bacterium]
MPLPFNLKSRALRGVLWFGSLGHIRHYRGHGIHSPFMYALVRNVLMKRPRKRGDTTLYESLRRQHVGHRTALHIQNLHNYCKYPNVVILDKTPPVETIVPQTTYIVTGSAGIDDTQAILAPIGESECMLYIVAPRRTRTRLRACREIIRRADCVSVDKGGFMFFVFNRRLQKQHYKL